jgi:tRNA pseudouridine55 synthase
LARRETYRSKNRELGGLNNPPDHTTPKFVIDPVLQKQYAEGKLILIDKPLHWTSFDMVSKVRSLLKIRKIGHAGTLDPLATGLLIICSGKFTKKINEYMADEKEYTGDLTLGAVTATYDLESQPEQFKDPSFVTNEMIYAAVTPFIGDIEQFPPIYSALKIAGEPLYKLARRGEEIELKARKVTVGLFEITNIDLPVVSFRIVCSTGTYIRSLANDYGQSLGCGAYLSKLRRTRIGECTVDNAQTIEQFAESLQPKEN